jgi:hypothetical protein
MLLLSRIEVIFKKGCSIQGTVYSYSTTKLITGMAFAWSYPFQSSICGETLVGAIR